MRDLFIEILNSIKTNRLRTCLTGFSVAWGIFMIIVLLGAGNGLLNSFSKGAGDLQVNTMMIGGGFTTKPYDGLQKGRRINLDQSDVTFLSGDAFSDVIDEVSATVSQSGLTVAEGRKHFSTTMTGAYPGHAAMNRVQIVTGRFIDRLDIEENRKVVVVSTRNAEILFGEHLPYSEAVGKRIRIGSLMFRIIGVYQADSGDMGNEVFAPFSTVMAIYAKGKYIDDLTFSFHGLDTEEANDAFETRLKAGVQVRHRAAPDDDGATWVWNRFTQNMQMDKAGDIIRTALWIVGFFTLLSGIVGVSNIMLITVKERTHEFGIRKAIGATPWSIMKLIMAESIVITSVFGYIGMVIGILACKYMDMTLGHSTMKVMDQEISMLVNPSVGIDVALKAMLLLVAAGTVAGMVPARKAARVRPIEALRAE